MGMATYYIKARFETEEAAGKAHCELQYMLDEAADAETFWQDNRGMDREGKTADFWSQYVEKFPRITAMIPDLVGGDCNNSLSGQVSISDANNDEGNSNQYEAQVTYFAYVWHFADWTRFEKWFKDQGAIAVAWLSDENMEPFDQLDVG